MPGLRFVLGLANVQKKGKIELEQINSDYYNVYILQQTVPVSVDFLRVAFRLSQKSRFFPVVLHVLQLILHKC